MPTAAEHKSLVPPPYALPTLLFLIAAGLAGNYYNFPIFLNIDFLFGSIFAMLALQLLGVGLGTLAAAAIAGSTYFLWNHPYAIVIMTAEVAVVGGVMRRQKIGLLLADTLYWLLFGMPMVYLFYHLVMHIPLSNTAIIMSKQALNGIANALVARLLFSALALRTRVALTSFGELTCNLFSFFVLCPTLILLAISSRADFSETDHQIRATLLQESQSETHKLTTWVENRKSPILTLAELASSKSGSEMQAYLEFAKKSDQNFLRIGLLDKSATITAYFPLQDEKGENNIGKNFADRPFIPILKETLKPMLSEVVMGRIGPPKPMVTMLAPVVKAGVYDGYVTGILNFQQVQATLDKGSEHSATLYTLLDKNGKVIMSNRPEQKAMTPFTRESGTLTPLADGVSQWVPIVPANTPISERWKRSFYSVTTKIGELAEWQLLLEQPVAPFQKKLYDRYTGKLSLLFLLFLGALLLAEICSRKMVDSLEKLRALSHSLPQQLANGKEAFAWPASGIKETNQLITNFRKMGDSLSEQFQEVRRVNETLEKRVAERTEQLSRVTQDLTIILENAPIGVSKIVDRRQVLVNRKTEEMFQYRKEEMEDKSTRMLYPSEEDYEKLGREAYPVLAQGEVFETVQELVRKDGAHIQVRYIGKALKPHDLRQGTLWLLEDITERMRAEKEREQFHTFFQTSSDMMCIADPNGAFLKTNPICTELLGYSTAELVARNFIDFIHPDDQQPTLDEMARQIERGYSLNFENRYRCKDGSWVWLSWRASYNKEEGITYAIARDITEQKRAQEALLEKTAQLEELTIHLEQRVKEEVELRVRNERILIQQSKLAAMGEMLGAISHQWRQPLNALGLIIQNLQDSAQFDALTKENVDGAVGKAMVQIQHMSKTINDFRNFFVPDKEKSHFDTMRAVGDVLVLLSAQLAANHIEYHLSCRTHHRTVANETGIVLCGEKIGVGYRNEFEHVILNLINNAREAILSRPPGSEPGRLEFEFYVTPTVTVIEVADNGGGIDPTIVDRIFEPYFTTKDPSKGTGLGLYMAKAIMEQMAGTLTASNREQGAVFTLTLPRTTALEAQERGRS